jgi:hypothetical protein
MIQSQERLLAEVRMSRTDAVRNHLQHERGGLVTDEDRLRASDAHIVPLTRGGLTRSTHHPELKAEIGSSCGGA